MIQHIPYGFATINDVKNIIKNREALDRLWSGVAYGHAFTLTIVGRGVQRVEGRNPEDRGSKFLQNIDKYIPD
jgi:hypothetical protein